MKCFLGIDIGTSSTKAELFTENFKKVKSATVTYEMDQPYNGWAQQEPVIWRDAALQVIKECVSELDDQAVLSIGLTGQMHGLVMLDEQGEVLIPSILWCDQRTTNQCETMERDLSLKTLLEETANPALTGFTASKILWVKENQPDVFAKCSKILLPKDYIRYIITGDFATDYSDASGFQLLNVKERKYSKVMLDYLGITEEQLPKLYESTTVTGTVKEELQKEWGIAHPIQVAAGGGDNAAAAIGMGVIEDNDTFITVGTSAVVFTQTSEMKQEAQGRVHTFCSAVPGGWHVMGVTQGAGSSIEKMKELFYSGASFDEINDEVKETVPGSEKLIYLPYLMGERTPHLDPHARAVFFGMSLLHEKRHFARSVYEGIGFSLRDCLELLKNMDVHPSSILITGGGGKDPRVVEIYSNILNEDLTYTESGGTTLGCALMAAVATGAYSNLKEAYGKVEQKEIVYNASQEVHEAYEPYYRLYRRLYESLKGDFVTLDNIVLGGKHV